MIAPGQDSVHVRDTGHDSVEVTGMSVQDVEYAVNVVRRFDEERIRARKVLETHLLEMQRDTPLVSEATQLQLQRTAELRTQLLQSEGAEDYESLAQLRGSQESSARTWVSRMRQRHELFTVEVRGHTLIPRVQLTAKGGSDPLIAELIRPLAHVGLDGWGIWA
ncbi:hypothetical protein C7K25_01520 [Gulosibacter molinativorax]|uniref:Uncharacterized protein n=1 Tax=Gulosibacter molinativorax TaxID=256821 RepID=A0ABT7C4B6_9MICO|nr:hypothetical protein [Gulosibacter molinativorax]QUY63748.1 Hypotetical protein [Gulosibacter molinativorax]